MPRRGEYERDPDGLGKINTVIYRGTNPAVIVPKERDRPRQPLAPTAIGGRRAAALTKLPYLDIVMVLLVAAGLAAIGYVSVVGALLFFVPIYWIWCWYRPTLALWIMFAAVAFPYDLSGGGLPINLALAELCLVLAYPLFWLRSVTRKRPAVSNPIAMPVWIYFATCLPSTIMNWSDVGRDAVVSMLQMIVYIVLAVHMFSSLLEDPRQMLAGLYGLISASTFLSLIVAIDRTGYVLGLHKNAVGTFLSYVVIIISDFWFTARGKRKRWLAFLLLFNGLGLIMSTSRGAWLGAVVGLAMMSMIRRQFRLFATILCFLVPAMVICWFALPQEQLDSALNISSDSNSVQQRLYTIAFYEDEFLQSPIFGKGVGLRKEADSTNIIMSTLGETGVLGLAAFMSIQVCFMWAIFRTMRKVSRSDPDFSVLTISAALVICLFVHGCCDHYWGRTQLPVWAMAGAAIAVYSARLRRPRPLVKTALAVIPMSPGGRSLPTR
jgi:O-Antigen ligase